MSLQNFRTYQLSIRFYHACLGLKLPRHLREQLLRAASSISLNLAEGYAKPTRKDQNKFFYISMGSLRESQAVLALARLDSPELIDLADHLGACLHKLTSS